MGEPNLHTIVTYLGNYDIDFLKLSALPSLKFQISLKETES
jgi:hypothetical protein